MNETENADQSRHEVSTSLMSGLAFLLFVLFVICAHSFNIVSLNLLWQSTMAFLFPVGILCAVVLSTDVVWKLLRPKTAPRKAALFLTPCLLLVGVVLVFVIGNGSMVPVIFIILFTPFLVVPGPIIACIALLRSGVPKLCALFLIASIALAIAAAPIALAIGSENKADEISLPLHPEVLCWLVCVAVSTILCRDSKNGFINVSAGAETSFASLRQSATVLWVLGAALWLIVLHWMLGIAEKGSG
jgi:hypothetical protein